MKLILQFDIIALKQTQNKTRKSDWNNCKKLKMERSSLS